MLREDPVKLKRIALLRTVRTLVPEKIPFDLSIIKPGPLIQARRSGYRNDVTLSWKSLSGYRSIAIIVLFSDVAADYYVRERLIPEIRRRFGEKETAYSYRLALKELAVISGLGKLGKNALFFSNKLGFNCKIDSVLFRSYFDDYDQCLDSKESPRLDSCRHCNICLEKCPVKAIRDYKLEDWVACDRLITPQWENPDNMCRACISECPASNRILRRLYQSGVPRNTRLS